MILPIVDNKICSIIDWLATHGYTCGPIPPVNSLLFWERTLDRQHKSIEITKDKIDVLVRESPLKEGWWQDTYTPQEFIDKNKISLIQCSICASKDIFIKIVPIGPSPQFNLWVYTCDKCGGQIFTHAIDDQFDKAYEHVKRITEASNSSQREEIPLCGLS